MHRLASTGAALNFSLHPRLRLVAAQAAEDEAKEVQVLMCLQSTCESVRTSTDAAAKKYCSINVA